MCKNTGKNGSVYIYTLKQLKYNKMLHNRRNFSGYEYYFLNDFSDIC